MNWRSTWFSVWVCLALQLLMVVCFLIIASTKKKRNEKKKMELPPGPPGWPIVGNLFQLGKKPNESLCRLAAKYGPLMTLRLGMKTAIVVSSPAMAKEILKTNDQIFAGRVVIQAAKCLSYHENSMIWCQYGPRWRMLRKIFNTELFSQKRIEALQHLRREQVSRMIRLIFQDSCSEMVDIGQIVFLTSVNLLGNMMFSENMFNSESRDSEEFKEIIWRMMELGGRPNLADFFPFLELLDPQGIRRKVTACLAKIYALFDKFIDDRLAARSGLTKNNHIDQTMIRDQEKDFLDILLDSRNSSTATTVSDDTADQFNMQGIKSVLLDMFQAGTHVTATTIEWAMAELLRKPETLKRAQEEVLRVVGCERKVEEDDIERLPYLHAVLKEVLRLHPPAPLLSNRADAPCQIAGFFVPKHTQTIINMWAMGRDPNVWTQPLEFLPQRFLQQTPTVPVIDYRGHNFELIPFGAGRRICPGLPLAHRILHLILASLLHSFDWSLPPEQAQTQLDMTEKFGLSLQKASPLKAIPTPRLSSHLY